MLSRNFFTNGLSYAPFFLSVLLSLLVVYTPVVPPAVDQ